MLQGSVNLILTVVEITEFVLLPPVLQKCLWLGVIEGDFDVSVEP